MVVMKALQDAYDGIEADAEGELSDSVAEPLFEALLAVGPARLGVVALRTAARAATYPQVHSDILLVDAASRADGSVGARERSAALHSAVSGAPRAPAWFQQRQNEAGAALAYALQIASSSDLAAWFGLLRAYRWAYLGGRQGPQAIRDGWGEWLDDVASVSDDDLARTTAWLARCLDGSLTGLPQDWTWEASFSERSQRYGVSVCEQPSGHLREPELELAGLRRVNRTIVARIEPRATVLDPLRTEYLVRHVLARTFQDDSSLLGGDELAFENLSTGEHWSYPLRS